MVSLNQESSASSDLRVSNIYAFVFVILTFVLIGFPLLVILGLVSFIMPILAIVSVVSNPDQPYSYPFIFRIIQE